MLVACGGLAHLLSILCEMYRLVLSLNASAIGALLSVLVTEIDSVGDFRRDRDVIR